MRTFFFNTLALILASLVQVQAQTALDLNHGLTFSHGTMPGSYSVRWWGKAQRKFYITSSEDLINWTYLPVTEWGADSPIQYNFTTAQPKSFVRLEYEDPPAYQPAGTAWGPGGSTFDQSATTATGMTANAWPLYSLNSGLNLNSELSSGFILQHRRAGAAFTGRHVYVHEYPPEGLRIRYDGQEGKIEPGVTGLGVLPEVQTSDAFHDLAGISSVLGSALSRIDAGWETGGSCNAGGDIDRLGGNFTSLEPGDPPVSSTVYREWDSGTFSETSSRLSINQPAQREFRKTYWFARRVNDSPTTSHTEFDGTVTFVLPKGGTVSNQIILSDGVAGKGTAVEGVFRMLAPPIQDFGLTHYHYLYDANIGYIADPLPVNTDFDEKKIGADGFAQPDCADASLIAAQGTDAGKLVTRDLWTGYFGLNPVSIPNQIRQSNGTPVVTITRVNPDPEDPEAEEEEGEVRMHIISQAVANGSGPFTDQPVDLGAPGSTAPVNMSEWYSEAMVGKWKTSFEGIKPGLITLKFTYVKGSYQFEHQQRFEVCTRKTTSQWLAEVRDQILLQTAGKADVDRYMPYAPAWQPQKNFVFNTREVAVIYEWYAQMFRQHPDKMDWMGIAHLVGDAVYAGLSEAQQMGGSGTTRPLQGGQVLIYRDMAWVHRAYQASGIRALEWVKANNDLPANGVSATNALDIAVWRNYDAAFRAGDYNSMQAITKRLTTREQTEIIVPMWAYLDNSHAGAVTVITNNAKNVVDPASPTFLDVMQALHGPGDAYDYKSSNADLRMEYSFDSPQHSVFQIWWGNAANSGGSYLNTAGRLGLVQDALQNRASLFTTFPLYPP